MSWKRIKVACFKKSQHLFHCSVKSKEKKGKGQILADIRTGCFGIRSRNINATSARLLVERYGIADLLSTRHIHFSLQKNK